jgi:two-component system chemotaxis response regulator CheB
VRRGPRENGTRPAIDPLFRSAAVICTTRVIGVLLTGLRNDGTSGLQAIRHVMVDHVLPLDEIPTALAALALDRRPPPARFPMTYAPRR